MYTPKQKQKQTKISRSDVAVSLQRVQSIQYDSRIWEQSTTVNYLKSIWCNVSRVDLCVSQRNQMSLCCCLASLGPSCRCKVLIKHIPVWLGAIRSSTSMDDSFSPSHQVCQSQMTFGRFLFFSFFLTDSWFQFEWDSSSHSCSPVCLGRSCMGRRNKTKKKGSRLAS